MRQDKKEMKKHPRSITIKPTKGEASAPWELEN
jgi:hypothetical protein